MSPLAHSLSCRAVVVLAGLLATVILVGCQAPMSSSHDASSVGVVASGHAPPTGHSAVPRELPRAEQGRAGSLDLADGELPDGVTVFDDQYPAVAGLDAGLLASLRRAAAAAARDGVRVYVDSGWRSRAYQEQLFREAVEKYGSEAQAARWVAPPGRSAHEAGQAVDLGPASATAWLSAHGPAYGLCQIYANEPWHYELRPAAATQGCPAMYADPTRDPRTTR